MSLKLGKYALLELLYPDRVKWVGKDNIASFLK